jgi:large repetitive protein
VVHVEGREERQRRQHRASETGYGVSVVWGCLPPGLSLFTPFADLTVIIIGTPPTEGLYTFVLKFSTSGSTFGYPEVGLPTPVEMSAVAVGNGTVGQGGDGGFFFGGGVAPETWSISGGALPSGLSVNATTSEISGIPTKAGIYAFTARLTDSTSTFPRQPRDHHHLGLARADRSHRRPDRKPTLKHGGTT